MNIDRSAGILLHITSLPGPYGIGDLGPEAYKIVDWMKSAGQSWWQVLPLGPANDLNYPHSARSSWAGSEGRPMCSWQRRRTTRVGCDRKTWSSCGSSEGSSPLVRRSLLAGQTWRKLARLTPRLHYVGRSRQARSGAEATRIPEPDERSRRIDGLR